MVYIISVAIIVACIAVIIFGLKVFKENRQLKSELKQKEQGDEKIRF
jgi:uncharacterized membrane protein